jgi:signal transduction histidine kinase
LILRQLAEIDKVQVQQVLFNLMRNSIEATEGQPKRELLVKTKPADHDVIEISVADNGPGLPSQVRDKLFQPFVTTKSNGMGVGLSVCKTIVEAHGEGCGPTITRKVGRRSGSPSVGQDPKHQTAQRDIQVC